MKTLSEQWPLYFSAGIALLAVEQAGLTTGWSSPVLARLQGPNSTIPVTSDEGAWIASVTPLANFITTPLPALTMHYWGRKITLLLSTIPFLMFWIWVVVAKTTVELIAARALAGVGVGFVYTVLPVYLGEISPDNIRGALGSSIAVTTNLGILWIYWTASYPELWISSLSSALPLIIIFIFYKWLPESPYFLLQKSRKDEAIQALRKLKNCNKVDEEIRKIESTINNSDSKGNVFKELFCKASNRRALFISMGTFTFLQLTGGATFLLYAHLIFQKAGNVSANTMSLIKATAQLLTSIGSTYFVDNVGRKPLLIISCIGCTICMTAQGVYFYLYDNNFDTDAIWWLPLASMILFNVFQVVGLFPISKLYLGELFHPKVKSMAVCISVGYLGLIVSVVGKLFQVMTDELGNCVPFFVFALVGVLGVFFVVFCVPETKGKSLEEIQYYMKYKTFRKDDDAKL